MCQETFCIYYVEAKDWSKVYGIDVIDFRSFMSISLIEFRTFVFTLGSVLLAFKSALSCLFGCGESGTMLLVEPQLNSGVTSFCKRRLVLVVLFSDFD